jgi:hypothetical protein
MKMKNDSIIKRTMTTERAQQKLLTVNYQL